MQSVRVVPADDDDDDQATEMNNSFTGEGLIAPFQPLRLWSFLLSFSFFKHSFFGIASSSTGRLRKECLPARVCVMYMFMILLCCTMSGCYIMSMKGSLRCSVSLQTLPPACEEGPVGQEFRLHSKDSALSILLWALNSIIALGIFLSMCLASAV